MPNTDTQPQSPNPVVPKGSNGVGDETQPDQEDETEMTYTHRKYVLEDFSQQAINRGQQEINYLITVAGERVVDAFNEVRSLIAILNAKGQVDLHALDAAIKEVSQAVEAIAGPFPPGCGDGSQTKPGGEG